MIICPYHRPKREYYMNDYTGGEGPEGEMHTPPEPEVIFFKLFFHILVNECGIEEHHFISVDIKLFEFPSVSCATVSYLNSNCFLSNATGDI